MTSLSAIVTDWHKGERVHISGGEIDGYVFDKCIDIKYSRRISFGKGLHSHERRNEAFIL